MTEPSLVRRRLGAELESARTLAGLSQREIADRLSISQSLVSRAEKGLRLLARPLVVQWLRAVSAGTEVREHVLALTAAAHASRTWSDQLADRAQLQGEESDRDRASAVVRSFHPTVLPGLAQTADYARHVIPRADLTGNVDHDAALAARIGRQAILREPGRRFDLLITEAALRWEPAPGLLAPQRAQLAAVLDLDTVRMAVLPAADSGAPAWHNFVIRYPADGSPASVSVELIHGGQELVDEESVTVYETLYDRLWSAAISDAAQVRELLTQG